jgi:glycosyltransferase involved in cell wall biosynthesis
MRVVLLSAEYPPMEGGIGDYTRRLALALRERELGVALLTTAGATGLPGDPLEVYPLVPGWGWGCLGTISRFLQQHRPDVVHLQYQTGAYRMHPAIHFLPGSLCRRPAPPRLVVTMHDLRLPYLFPKAGLLRHLLVTRLLRRADAVVVTNGADLARLGGAAPTPGPSPWRGRGAAARDLLRPLAAGTLPRRPDLIPLGSSLPTALPGYDRGAWRARLDVEPEDALLGYFGLLHPSKGADLLVEALGELGRAGRPARLAVIGGGTGASDPGNVAFAEALCRQIAQAGLGAAVHWTGPCPAEEAAAYLKACDLVVLPYRDGASFRRSSLVAALALGCAVVTTAPLDPAEAALGPGQPSLASGVNVALVPREDAAELVEAIAGLLGNAARRQRLGEEAGRLGEAFRWEVVARRTAALYTDLVSALTQQAGPD